MFNQIFALIIKINLLENIFIIQRRQVRKVGVDLGNLTRLILLT